MKNISKRQKIILYNIINLCYLYAIVAFAYAFIYMVVDLIGLGELYDRTSEESNINFLQFLFRHIYFSFVTLTLVGFGDIHPLGLSRLFSISQALLGYILPYAIVLNTIIYSPKFFNKIRN